jgi:gamma-tubulin complex component 3
VLRFQKSSKSVIFVSVYIILYFLLAGLHYNDLEGLESCINNAYRITSRHLLNILYNRYKLIDHMKALKRFLLLGQGEFIQCLMDILG